MRLARRALELAEPGAPPVIAERRLAEIALRGAPEIAALRRALLAPLDGQTPASRARLEATLLQWLRHRGAQGAIAAELAVHPQTVRYRMARLRDLMGEALDDPEAAASRSRWRCATAPERARAAGASSPRARPSPDVVAAPAKTPSHDLRAAYQPWTAGFVAPSLISLIPLRKSATLSLRFIKPHARSINTWARP